MSDLTVQFVGTGGTTPSKYRGLPATLISRDGFQILVDVGEGTQRSLMQQDVLGHYDVVALTHYHADHWLGLMGLLKSWDLQERTKPLRIVGPKGLSMVKSVVHSTGEPKNFNIEWGVTGDSDWVIDEQEWSLRTFATYHGVPSVGYVLQEKERPGKLDVAKARALGVTDGRDYGRLKDGYVVTSEDGSLVQQSEVVGPPRRGRKVVITGDAPAHLHTINAAQDADLLIHDGSFLLEDIKRANKTKHGNVDQVARLARIAEVRRLALVHTQPRYSKKAIYAEADNAYPEFQAEVPDDGTAINIPLDK